MQHGVERVSDRSGEGRIRASRAHGKAFEISELGQVSTAAGRDESFDALAMQSCSQESTQRRVLDVCADGDP